MAVDIEKEFPEHTRRQAYMFLAGICWVEHAVDFDDALKLKGITLDELKSALELLSDAQPTFMYSIFDQSAGGIGTARRKSQAFVDNIMDTIIRQRQPLPIRREAPITPSTILVEKPMYSGGGRGVWRAIKKAFGFD